MRSTKGRFSKTLHFSIVLRFCNHFKFHYIFFALCFCLVSCEQYETFDNNIFTTSIPKGSREISSVIGFNGFTYSYNFTTPDNQEIGIEIVPWIVDLPKLINCYIDLYFPQEKQGTSDIYSFNSFRWGLREGKDREIYQDEDLLDGWCYAFHTITGESICIYTLARKGHCRSIKKLITDFKIKPLSKPSYTSLLSHLDNLMATLLQEQYHNSTIYFTQSTSHPETARLIHTVGGTECGIMVMMNENREYNAYGMTIHPDIQLDNTIKYFVNILNRHYDINFKYPDDTIEHPSILY